jgi:hypothetical protein
MLPTFAPGITAYGVTHTPYGQLRHHGGRVYWSDCWERIWDLVADGTVTEKCYGPATYNHSEFFVVAT